ncbi:MAG TPA: thiamine pyrophosphate-dependent enzyme [Longilinea sp.]|nr:thiamine pyrophosphate-dependent enzyme [Longilinea sp.]
MPKNTPSLPLSPEELIRDYRQAFRSRQASAIGRREVLSGKAKFGIFGDGKEVPQLAIAHSFKKGDWRSGYYRDQTWMFALGVTDLQKWFAALYAHEDPEAEPMTGGRNMGDHFNSRSLNPDGTWRNLTQQYNVSPDLSPTAAQMPRAVGLAYASKLYRELDLLKAFPQFSRNGDEVTWVTVGNASTAEGLFWEAVNAIGVLHVPAVITVYDDGYGISVPNQFQMVKENIFAIMKGFERLPCPADECDRGYDLYSVHAWDYPEMLAVYEKAATNARKYHIPALVHVTDVTQPFGHSTSGSHERYKSKERLQWEEDFDGIRRLRAWLIEKHVATEEQLAACEAEDTETVEAARKTAWAAFRAPIEAERTQCLQSIRTLAANSTQKDALNDVAAKLEDTPDAMRHDLASALHSSAVLTRDESSPARDALLAFLHQLDSGQNERLSSHLYSQSAESALNVEEVKPVYSEGSPTVMGFEVVNAAFDAALGREPRLVAFGEDVGKLGDVNQGFRGMQEKYGALRVTDTGIREATILGQAIGLALRGLRPICEIQYLDYLLFALQTMADDLANLHWRTVGGQKAPVIVRTRGHRLEGVWHSGSPMAGILNLVHGMHVLVPRDMTQAAGFYNTLLKGDDPALLVEVLNGYRRKERLPDNIGEFTVPLGVPEVLRQGSDVTVVTYGACCHVALDAAEKLDQVGIRAEVVDVQTLLPFDRQGRILESLKKTERVLFVDEDVPGGTTAYMLRQVLEVQGGYAWLDSAPATLPGSEHRPAYGNDGDYWSKPNAEGIFDAVYKMMNEANPARYPALG